MENIIPYKIVIHFFTFYTVRIISETKILIFLRYKVFEYIGWKLFYKHISFNSIGINYLLIFQFAFL